MSFTPENNYHEPRFRDSASSAAPSNSRATSPDPLEAARARSTSLPLTGPAAFDAAAPHGRKALSFDDVLLSPQFSPVKSRREVLLDSRVSREIMLRVPIIASYMDTVCESTMATALARLGAMGVIHRWMTVAEQVEEVQRVKRAENIVIRNPYSLPPDASVEQIREYMEKYNIGGITITDEQKRLLGIVTTRDIEFRNGAGLTARDVMTPRVRLVVGRPSITPEEAMRLLQEHKVEKLPLVDDHSNELRGLISKKDMRKRMANNLAVRDQQGHLVVGASIGIRERDFLARTEQLLRAGTDVIVLAIANGYLASCRKAVEALRYSFPSIDLIAGDVATYEGARALFQAGADGVLVGIGPGSVCKTRIVTGFGVPQFTALLETARAAREAGKVIWSDGGVRYSGDLVKAVAAGASAAVMGSVLAGTDEAPGKNQIIDGTRVKLHRGLASYDAKEKLEKINQEEDQKNKKNLEEDFYYHIEAEGVESAFVPYRGSARETLRPFVGGLRSGMSYAGARTVPELWKIGEEGHYYEITEAGQRESHPHSLGIHIG